MPTPEQRRRRLATWASAPYYLLSRGGRAKSPQRVILHLDPAKSPGAPSLADYRRVIGLLEPTTTLELRGTAGQAHPLFWPLLEEASSRQPVVAHLDAGLLTERQIGHLLELSPSRRSRKGLGTLWATLRGDEASHDRAVGRPGDARRLQWALRTLADRRDSDERSTPSLVVRAVLDERTAIGFQGAHALAKAAHADRLHLSLVHIDVEALAPAGSDRTQTLGVAPQTREDIDTSALEKELRTIDASRKYGWETLELTIDHGLVGRREVLAHLAGQGPPLRCSSPWRWVHIGPAGEVYVCPRFSLGTIAGLPLDDLYFGIVACGFRRQLRSAGSFPACRGCEGAAAHSRLG